MSTLEIIERNNRLISLAIKSAKTVEGGTDLIKEEETNMFNSVRESASGFEYSAEGRTEWEQSLKPSEDAEMEEIFKTLPECKKKNGEWKYAKYLPKKYYNAKWTIGTCLEKGIPIETLGKSALQKKIKDSNEKLADDSERVAAAKRLLGRVTNIIQGMDSREKQEIETEVEILIRNQRG